MSGDELDRNVISGDGLNPMWEGATGSSDVVVS